MRSAIAIAAAVLCLAAASGCAATKAGDADDIRRSGFLSSYDGLAASGDSDRAAFTYMKPGVNLSGYHAIVVDRPVAHVAPETLASVGPDEMAGLLTSFEASLQSSLGSKFRIVQTPGPGVLRVRTALTDADSATAPLTVFSRLLPAGVVISKGKQLLTGTAVNVGKASAEMEVVDSVSGEQLGAAIDRRVGTGAARNVLSSWGDVTAAFDVWAERLAARLTENGLGVSK